MVDSTRFQPLSPTMEYQSFDILYNTRHKNDNKTTTVYTPPASAAAAAAAALAAFLASSFFARACQDGSYRNLGFVPSSAIVRLLISRESSLTPRSSGGHRSGCVGGMGTFSTVPSSLVLM